MIADMSFIIADNKKLYTDESLLRYLMEQSNIVLWKKKRFEQISCHADE